MFEEARADFARLTDRAFSNLEALLASELKEFSPAPIEGHKPGIYILYEGAQPVYVGRTKKLKQRFRAHITPSHNSASFALKRVRKRLGLASTYKKKGSRGWIVENHRSEFLQEIESIKRMKYRFLEVSDNIDQYFLEYLSEAQLGLDHDGLDTS